MGRQLNNMSACASPLCPEIGPGLLHLLATIAIKFQVHASRFSVHISRKALVRVVVFGELFLFDDYGNLTL